VYHSARAERARSIGYLLLVAALSAGAGLRAWLSFHDDGIYWPDEIYQSLEPAHRLVFGYGLIAWEFVQGARSWALPGIIAAVLKLCDRLGLSEPGQYVHAARLFFSAVGVATAYASYRLARSYGASTLAAACSGALFSLVAPAIYFAPRAMSETASALPVALGLALVLAKESSRRAGALGISFLGLAVMLRLQNAVVCLALIAILASRRDWRRLSFALGMLAIWALLYGLLDKLTWGGWFHSAITYLRANVVEHKSELWGTSPTAYYVEVLWRSMAAPAVCIALLSLLAMRRALGLWLTAAAFVLLHSAIPHKELRFILPALPLWCALAGIGLDVLGTRLRFGMSALAVAAVLLAAVRSAWRFHDLTFGDLGQYEQLKPHTSAYDDFGSVNRLLLAAHRRPDLCGLKIEAVHLAWTGGYTYLHRQVPLYSHLGPPRTSRFYNYVIAFAGSAADGVAAADGAFVLQHLRVGSCIQDAGYQWLLP
jgi:hypothetical protein